MNLLFQFYRHGWDGNRDKSDGEGKEGEEKEPAGEMHPNSDPKLKTS